MAAAIRGHAASIGHEAARRLLNTPHRLPIPTLLPRPQLQRSFATTTPNPPQYHLLLYTYVDRMVERRQPIRPLHLAHAQAYVERQQLLLAGACPPDVKDAVLCFAASRPEVEEFARKDPYVLNGLVTEWKVKEWAVVMGSAMNK